MRTFKKEFQDKKYKECFNMLERLCTQLQKVLILTKLKFVDHSEEEN